MAARGEATRTKLLETAIRLVGEVGYARTTTKAIAEAAGVAEGTIYRHFPDKATLLGSAVLHRNAPVVRWMEHLPQRAGQGSVAENLTECLTQLARLREDVVPLELAILGDPELSRAARQPLPSGALPGPPEHLAAYLAAEQRLGRVRGDVDPRRTAVVLLATLFGLAVAPPGAAGLLPELGEAVTLIVDGLAPRPA